MAQMKSNSVDLLIPVLAYLAWLSSDYRIYRWNGANDSKHEDKPFLPSRLQRNKIHWIELDVGARGLANNVILQLSKTQDLDSIRPNDASPLVHQTFYLNFLFQLQT